MTIVGKLLFLLKVAALNIFALTMLLLSKLMIRWIPFRKLLPLVTDSREESIPELDIRDQRRAQWVGQTVSRLGRGLPWESKCYDQALAAAFILKAVGLPGTLHFGIKKNHSGSIDAHAWLRAGGHVITGAEEAPGYTVLLKGSFNGRKRNNVL